VQKMSEPSKPMKDFSVEEWQAALRSGKYIQGRGSLCQWNDTTNQWEYCCLGVLCDMYDPDGWEEFSTKIRKYQGKSLYLSSEVARWAGLSTSRTDAQDRLSRLNDAYISGTLSHKFDFDVIADGLPGILASEHS
jgi:maltoporin